MTAKQNPWKTYQEMEPEYRALATAPESTVLDFGCWLPTLGRVVRPRVPGEMVLGTAQTGVGKTGFIDNLAFSTQQESLTFQQELPLTQVFERGVAMATDTAACDIERLYRDGTPPSGFSYDALGHMHVCTESGLTIERIEKLIHLAKESMIVPPVVVYVDYAGLMRSSGGSKYEQMSKIAQGLKRLAKDCEVVMMVNAQVARKAPELGPEIHLYDAKDSGELENSAQLVLGFWRDSDDSTIMWIKVCKNNKGKSGFIVGARFNGRTMRITPMSGGEIEKLASNGNEWAERCSV